MTDRRRLLHGAVATVLGSTTTLFTGLARAGSKSPEHSVTGGMNGIMRARFTYTPTSTDGTLPTIPLPKAGYVYMVPITVGQFDETLGNRFQMAGDGMVTIRQTGLYQLTANWDWPGQHGVDVDLREIYIKRVLVGQAAPAYTAGQVTLLPYTGTKYDNLAALDTPAADPSVVDRVSITWSPGTIAAGGVASVDVAVPTSHYKLVTGDTAVVGLTSLSDASLGTANRGVLLSARVVAPGVVRVWLENRYNASAVAVPSGTLNVVGASSTLSTGNSADAWTYLSTPIVLLQAGEKVLVAAKSNTAGDYLQISDGSFLQITALA